MLPVRFNWFFSHNFFHCHVKKNNVDNVYPCLSPVLIVKPFDVRHCALTLAVILRSVILIGLTSFVDTFKSCKISIILLHLAASYAFLKSMNNTIAGILWS